MGFRFSAQPFVSVFFMDRRSFLKFFGVSAVASVFAPIDLLAAWAPEEAPVFAGVDINAAGDLVFAPLGKAGVVDLTAMGDWKELIQHINASPNWKAYPEQPVLS